MDLQTFLRNVRELGRIDSDDRAMAATTATLSVLGERLAGGEPRHVGAQLPPELADAIDTRGPGERFDIEELFLRVAAREGGDIVSGQRHAEAVLTTLGQAITPGERDDMAAQLPPGWRDLLG
jgi:uncharacterized protein (DUF2267 family)